MFIGEKNKNFFRILQISFFRLKVTLFDFWSNGITFWQQQLFGDTKNKFGYDFWGQ